MQLAVFIMAGGSGERFWPLSTREKPKQLLKLVDKDRSLIRMTVDRVLPIVPAERIFIGTNAIQAKGIAEELPMLPLENIIIEPQFKDTAAAIGFGSVVIGEKYPDATMVVLASDHLIRNEANFCKRILAAAEAAAEKEAIVTLGIKPSRPETGYGYLETEDCYIGEPTPVIRFWEKPNLQRAESYVASGRYLWNSGMFIFKIATMNQAFAQYLPKHAALLAQIATLGDAKREHSNAKLNELFGQFEKISIDFGIMEKFHNTLVIPVDFGWNDIGSFPALDDVFDKSENGSVIQGSEVVEVSSSNNIILGKSGKVIATLGVKDLVIVDTENSLLVCSKAEAQSIKKVLEILNKK